MNKLLSMTAVGLLCSTGLAFAAEDPSGRPGKILDKDQCQQTWNDAGPDGDMLSETKATPYVLNFPALDTSNDRKISKDEWMAGCNKGWVSADARQVSPLNTKAGNETQSGEMADENKNKDSGENSN